MPVELHVYIEVPDLERGIAFYRDGLGLSLRRTFDAGWAELSGATVPVFLLGGTPRVSGSAPVPADPFARHWTPVHLDVMTDDLDAAVRRAVGAGALLEREIRQRRWGRIAALSDPFGNAFDLLEMGPRGYDVLLDES
jgi:predicted enzyme related to lactoylglutathione lyase